MPSTKESPRIRALKSAPMDAWIVLSEDESTIIASASTYAEAVKKSDDAGVGDPLIVRTPKEWIPFSV